MMLFWYSSQLTLSLSNWQNSVHRLLSCSEACLILSASAPSRKKNKIYIPWSQSLKEVIWKATCFYSKQIHWITEKKHILFIKIILFCHARLFIWNMNLNIEISKSYITQDNIKIHFSTPLTKTFCLFASVFLNRNNKEIWKVKGIWFSVPGYTRKSWLPVAKFSSNPLNS